jgi:hypothetical protein
MTFHESAAAGDPVMSVVVADEIAVFFPNTPEKALVAMVSFEPLA